MNSANSQMLITTHHIKRWYQRSAHRVLALQDISLQVNAGDFLAIMGPSGSGKSTLLHILGGLDRPSEGTYLYKGQDLSQVSDRALSALRAREIGFVFQTFNLIPDLTVFENVALPFSYATFPEPQDLELRVNQAIEQVGLAERADHRPLELSGGEMQRTALARAMVIRPQLILADEPTGNLDRRNSTEVMDLLLQLNQGGTTVMIVTHDPQIAALATRTLMLNDGRLEA